jgi:hypothetical protein
MTLACTVGDARADPAAHEEVQDTKKSCAWRQVVYAVIGTGLYLVFQDDTRTDVLLNFSGRALGPLIGEGTAEVVTYVVWLGYAFNLIVRVAAQTLINLCSNRPSDCCLQEAPMHQLRHMHV